MEIRVGNGFDVHAFTSGKNIILCGVKIPYKFALSGHSDADVGFHALTDSIFGALAEGDIGCWFPPSDTKWKNANSEIFLKKALDLMTNKKYHISNLDLTFICETPRLSEYSELMKKNISRICNLQINTIGVKATTTEKLGFLGRNEGIACMASVLLYK